jgi:hypothetical protein
MRMLGQQTLIGTTNFKKCTSIDAEFQAESIDDVQGYRFYCIGQAFCVKTYFSVLRIESDRIQ